MKTCKHNKIIICADKMYSCYYGHTVLDMWWITSAYVRIYCMYMHILHFYPIFVGDRRKLNMRIFLVYEYSSTS